MLREQMISFLQSAVIFLLLTNAVSGLAAAYAIRMAKALVPRDRRPQTAIEGKIDRLVRGAV